MGVGIILVKPTELLPHFKEQITITTISIIKKEKIKKIIDDNFIKLEEVDCRFYDYWEPNLLMVPLKNYLISQEKFDELIKAIKIIDEELRK